MPLSTLPDAVARGDARAIALDLATRCGPMPEWVTAGDPLAAADPAPVPGPPNTYGHAWSARHRSAAAAGWFGGDLLGPRGRPFRPFRFRLVVGPAVVAELRALAREYGPGSAAPHWGANAAAWLVALAPADMPA